MVKVVYLVLTHTNPEQILRLVKSLSNGNSASHIVIHHNYSCSDLCTDPFERFNNVHLVEDPVCVRWGEFSLTQAVLHSIEWISRKFKFDWLVFISGQDYPVQSIREIEKFLNTTNYDGFIRAVPLEKAIPCGPVECPLNSSSQAPCVDCTERYYYRYYKLPAFPYYSSLPGILKNSLKKARKRFNRAQSLFRIRPLPDPAGPRTKVGVKPLWSPFSSSFECYKGSLWFTVNFRSISYLKDFIQKNPRFVDHYRRTIHPDESFFATLLLNNHDLNLLNDDKRFISWKSHQSPNPDVLGVKDFDRIIASKQHFGRKFDINQDAEILSKLDEHIGISLPSVA